MEAPDGTTATAANSFILGILWNDPVWRNKSAGTCQENLALPWQEFNVVLESVNSQSDSNLQPVDLAIFYVVLIRKPILRLSSR